MTTKLEEAKKIVKEAVEYYINGCEFDSDYEFGIAEEGAGLSLDELTHPSGSNVREMIDEIEDDDDWDDDYLSVDLKKYEDEIYAKTLAGILSEKTGKDCSAEWDSEVVAPFSQTYGAWVISIEDDGDDEDE